jgi:hypothetical protein
MMTSTVIESLEVGRCERRELLDLLSTRTDSEIDLAIRVLRMLFDKLDRCTARPVAPLDDADSYDGDDGEGEGS